MEEIEIVMTDKIKQEMLEYQAQQQKAYDDYMEWYQTVGCWEEEKRKKCYIFKFFSKKDSFSIDKESKKWYNISKLKAFFKVDKKVDKELVELEF